MGKECWNCMGGQGDTEGVGCADCQAGNPPSNWRAGPNYAPDTNADRIAIIIRTLIPDARDGQKMIVLSGAARRRNKRGAVDV